jgi:pimeloyl-ACP methyl ester carboxylesterase
MLNDLLDDRRIRERYEFWFFLYSTGNPIPYSAMLLRDSLQDAVNLLDPSGTDAALRDMVVIGHSQGGLLTKMTAIDAGSSLWDAFSSRPLETLRVSDETRDLLRRALFVTPLPSVRRVVFVATPHRGSYVAAYSLAHWIARFVKLPVSVLGVMGDLAKGNPDDTTFDPKRMKMGAVYGMTPRNPMINALAAIPVAPGVAANSIIAVKGDGPVETGSDGVVQYQSAHIDGVESEFVVRSPHSCQANPATIEEVRRILLEHAEKACHTGISCPPPNEESPATLD